MSKAVFIVFIVVIAVASFIFFKTSWGKIPHGVTATPAGSHKEILWKYQCFDTMKTSRDKVRTWAQWDGLNEHIDSQMRAIVEMGGNCVAIDTPYDEEFLPYLRKWEKAARDYKLRVWYRGNFSAWEGWNDYPRRMTAEEHLAKTNEFILGNPQLFRDGDIFTPSPEAENGGPFNQVEKDEHEVFRAYLIKEYTQAKQAFSQINRTVEVNYLSMNGGLARRMLDQATLDALGGVVSIDHYIKTSPEMGEFIRYFNEKFGAKVVIGEWGAPIPEINGDMSEEEQADFIEELLGEMYQYNEVVPAVNYWDLYDGSTAIMNPDGSLRKASERITNYFKPGKIKGQVKDNRKKPLWGAVVQIDNGRKVVTTDKRGEYEVLVPAGKVQVDVSHVSYQPISHDFTINRRGAWKVDFILEKNEQDL